jgi:hypothetical protein
MKYNCDCCNYETDRKSSFNKHILTQKHIDNSNIAVNNATIINLCKPNVSTTKVISDKDEKSCVNVDVNKEISNNNLKSCNNCDKFFSCRQSLYRHRKTCKKNDGTTIAELKAKIKLLEQEAIIREKDVELKLLQQETKYLREQVKDKDSFKFIAESTAKNTDSSLSALNYIIKHYNNAPPIHTFSNYNLFFLGNEKFTIPQIMMHYHKKKELHSFIGDKLLLDYKKEDNPGLQSFWNTDATRQSFALREKGKNGAVWSKDKEGLRTSHHAVKPALKYIKGELEQYKTGLSKEMEDEDLPVDKQIETINNLKSASEIIMSIESDELRKNIVKYMSPSMYLVRDKPINKTN